MRIFWSVAVGAALGGVSRYYLGAFVQQRMGMAFPTGTLLINVSGSLLLGFIMRFALKSDAVPVEMLALLATGFCGGYTTFSTFTYEIVLMLEDGDYARAAVYVCASVGLAIAATFLGFLAADRLVALRRAV